MRVGIGYDVHALAKGKEFWLGGIKLQHHKGAIAHSDGDVLVHAICDALLGAAALRDIGFHFPDSSIEFEGIDSKKLLKRVGELLEENGYAIVNIDSVVCLQQPKVKELVSVMQQTLEGVLGLSAGTISIKATTTERLGFVGREEGVAAHVVALVRKV